MRDAERDGGINSQELEVAFLGRRAQSADNPLVLGGRVTLHSGTEGRGITGHAIDELQMRGPADQQQF